ncbi:MAG: MFS transporter [Rhodobacteraceae bacterium]|nr:MFS transporter [Paracoccaceae bacterium]
MDFRSSQPTVTLAETRRMPVWRSPIGLLMVMAAAMPIAFSVWSALLNNFVVSAAGFTGVEIGWLQSVREIPGFLAIGAILVIMVMREQTLALISLLMLGLAVAATAFFPSFSGLLLTTLIGSIGFHYYETMNQSLQLQWLDKREAPEALGRLIAMGSAASFAAYGLILVLWIWLDVGYMAIYLLAGLSTAALALFCWFAYPRFEAPHPQRKTLVLRRRYGLYYALQCMAGARRQIFVVFAAFMMVERFGFTVPQVTGLFMVTFATNIFLAPAIGRMVSQLGERTALGIEYLGLLAVFLCYGGLYVFDWGPTVAAALYVIDHVLFALALSLKTYFQKIADPADIAPTAAVAFTINHIAAVFLPASLGYLWIVSPRAVFLLAAAMALTSFCLAMLIPRHPVPGRETILSRGISPAAVT